MLVTKDLGDGLVLRAATRADGDELAEFNAAHHSDDALPASLLAAWTLDLMSGDHPDFRPDEDASVVVDSATGRIVSALFLLPQTWNYDGLTVPVGQPELIATDPDHRRRGLIRAQFEVIHAHSDADHLWQFISGIPWYYRQFGYDYALDFLTPRLWWFKDADPPPAPGWALRPAGAADVPFLAAVEARAQRRPGLGPIRGTSGWVHELRRRTGSLGAVEPFVIEHDDGGRTSDVGYVVRYRTTVGERVTVVAFELVDGVSWLAAAPAVLGLLRDRARAEPARPKALRVLLPPEHPSLRATATRWSLGPGPLSGYYVRIPDPIRLLDHLRPALERRLDASPAAGHTGTLRIDLYTMTIAVSFVAGRITGIERAATKPDDSDVALPKEAFAALVLGNRPLRRLENDMADCEIRSDAGALLAEVLFPRLPLSPWEFG